MTFLEANLQRKYNFSLRWRLTLPFQVNQCDCKNAAMGGITQCLTTVVWNKWSSRCRVIHRRCPQSHCGPPEEAWQSCSWGFRWLHYLSAVEWKWKRALTCMFVTSWPLLAICCPPASPSPTLTPVSLFLLSVDKRVEVQVFLFLFSWTMEHIELESLYRCFLLTELDWVETIKWYLTTKQYLQ